MKKEFIVPVVALIKVEADVICSSSCPNEMPCEEG